MGSGLSSAKKWSSQTDIASKNESDKNFLIELHKLLLQLETVEENKRILQISRFANDSMEIIKTPKLRRNLTTCRFGPYIIAYDKNEISYLKRVEQKNFPTVH